MTGPVEHWAIVELMGHRRIAGKISEVQRFGAPFCQLDVPHGDGFRSSLYGGSAIYGVHFCNEREAREAAKHASPRPFSWILDRAQLSAGDGEPAPRGDFDEGDEHDDDDDDPEVDPPTDCGRCGKALGDEFVTVEVERELETRRELWHRDCAEEHAAEWKVAGDDQVELEVDGVPQVVEGKS